MVDRAPLPDALENWETFRFVKQSYQVEDIRVLRYQRLKNLVLQVTAAAYFAARILGTKIEAENPVREAAHHLTALLRHFPVPILCAGRRDQNRPHGLQPQFRGRIASESPIGAAPGVGAAEKMRKVLEKNQDLPHFLCPDSSKSPPHKGFGVLECGRGRNLW